MPIFNPNKGEVVYLCGGGFDESLIKLSISGDSLQPAEVTKLLGFKPTSSNRKGDISENKKRIMKQGNWLVETPWVSKYDFETNLEKFIAKIPAKPSVWKRLTRRYACTLTAVLRMRTFNRGAEIPPKLLLWIARRGLRFDLDIYADADAKLWSEKRTRKRSR